MTTSLTADLTAAIAVDVVAFVYEVSDPRKTRPAAESVSTLLVGRPGNWELPGALVRVNEPFEVAARRAIVTKSGYDASGWYLDQLATFGAVDRDSRGRVVSVGHIALSRVDDLHAAPNASCQAARWFPISLIPWSELAWDHPTILRTALQRLRSKLRYSWVAFELLPNPFSVSDLRELYAAFYGERVARLSTSNFLKGFRPLLASGELVPVGDVSHDGRRGRPPARYRFVGEPHGTRERELPW